MIFCMFISSRIKKKNCLNQTLHMLGCGGSAGGGGGRFHLNQWERISYQHIIVIMQPVTESASQCDSSLKPLLFVTDCQDP